MYLGCARFMVQIFLLRYFFISLTRALLRETTSPPKISIYLLLLLQLDAGQIAFLPCSSQRKRKKERKKRRNERKKMRRVKKSFSFAERVFYEFIIAVPQFGPSNKFSLLVKTKTIHGQVRRYLRVHGCSLNIICTPL